MRFDKIKESLFGLVRAASPRVDYYALYFGKVIAWNDADSTVDVQPDDPKLPTMSHVPVRFGLPGVSGVSLKVEPNLGTSVLVGWENGDPSRHFACLPSGGEHVLSITLNADQIIVGGGPGAELAAKGETLQSYLEALALALSTHVHTCSAPGNPSSPSPTLISDAPVPTGIKPPTVTSKKAKVN